MERGLVMPEKVRAMVSLGPGKMEMQEFPYPSPGRGAAVVKMIMSGICGTDKHSYKGETKQYAGTPREFDIPYPIIQGHENVGIIADIDEEGAENLEFNGERLRVGDRVTWSPDVVCGKCFDCRYHAGYSWCQNMVMLYGNNATCAKPPHLFGGFSEYMYLIPGTHVYKVPEELSDEGAMLAELFSCSYNVDKAKEYYSFSGDGFAVNDTVVVQGVGPLGITHMIKARILGAGKIVAIDTSDFKLGMAKQFGADYVINAAQTTAQERNSAIMEITKGRGADVIIECVGRPQLIPEAIAMVRKGGMILEPGNFVDTGEIPINIHHICSKNIRLIGQSSLTYTGFTPSMEMMVNYGKQFPFEKLVTHYYGLEQTEEAILKSMEPDSMKVVVCGNK
jgi:threonine dehydrogenase-like Zn-dependent dehydrogenase